VEIWRRNIKWRKWGTGLREKEEIGGWTVMGFEWFARGKGRRNIWIDYVDLRGNQSGKCGNCFGIAITWEELKIFVWPKRSGAMWEKSPLEIVLSYPAFSCCPVLRNSLVPYEARFIVQFHLWICVYLSNGWTTWNPDRSAQKVAPWSSS
jgi:hypothetical protein